MNENSIQNPTTKGSVSRVLPSVRQVTALAVIAALTFTLGQTPAGAEEAPDSTAVLKSLSLEELMDLEVTSVSKRLERLAETASAIQVVTGEDIRRSGATSIPEALRLAGNLQVAQKGSHAWGISARGFNTDSANKLLVLIDGRAVYTPLFSGVFWDRQDYLLADLERIEVISGPGSTLWGSNAVNGVINIISKSAKDTQGGHIEAGAGNELESSGGVRYGGTLAPKVYYRVYGKYSDHRGALFANGSPTHDAWQMRQGGFRVDAELSAENTFTLQSDVYRNEAELVTGGDSTVNGANVLGRWSHVFASGSDMSLQVYYDRTRLVLPVAASVISPAGTLRDDLDTYDVDFQHNFTMGDRHRLVWGLGYRFIHDTVQNAPSLGFMPPESKQDLFNGYVQDEITLRENVVFTLGTKVEHTHYTGFEVEPSARLQWSVTDRQMVWTAVSRAVRTPSRFDRDISQPSPGYLLVILKGGAEFVSEKLTAYELGYRAQISEVATLSVSAYYNEYTDVRSTTISPPDPLFGLPFPFYFENNLEGETSGVEFAASYQARDWWRLHASYNVMSQNLGVKPGRMDYNNAHNETADPGHQWSLRSSMDLPGNLELDASWRWVDSLPTNNSGVVYTLPAYTELDARLAWHPRADLEFALVGQSLLHGRHREYFIANSPLVDLERRVYGKVTWRF